MSLSLLSVTTKHVTMALITLKSKIQETTITALRNLPEDHCLQDVAIALRTAKALRSALHQATALPSLPPAAPAPRIRPIKIACPPAHPPSMHPSSSHPHPDYHANRHNNLSTPFTGELAGATWNAQAFFARDSRRHFRKDKYVRRLLAFHDFVVLTETHSSTGEALAWRHPLDTTSWWSHGTATRAGVGILVQN